MTGHDALRQWALSLRDLCELNSLRAVSVTLEDGTHLAYVPGKGLKVVGEQETLTFSEEWVEGDRWALSELATVIDVQVEEPA